MKFTASFHAVILFQIIAGMIALPTLALAATGAKSPIVTIGNARFTVITPELIRMEYSAKGKFIDEPSMFAINRKALYSGFKLTKRGGSTTIDTGIIKLTYTLDGKAFSDKNLRAEIKKNGRVVEWRHGIISAGNLGGTIRTVDGVQGPVSLGEGLLSRDGWYVLDDSKGNLLTKDWVESRPKTAGSDLYLFGYGDDYMAALKSLSAVSGPAPMPRRYSLGAWYSRYWPYTSKEYRQIVQEYKEHDFPLDVIVMDMDWHRDGWTGWSWNRNLLPDAEDLLKWFHKNGLHVTLNVHPADGVGPHEDAYAQFMKDMGQDPSTKKTVTYDAGDKKYLDTIFKDVHAPLEKEGVDFWWLDWQQYQFTKSVPDLTNLAWLNHYYYTWTGRDGLRGQSFSRWAGWGDQRNPIHFSGDAHTGWPMLAFEVAMTSTAGNVGAFFWSHDIGGHMGPRNVESYTRWVQFGATSAALRSHSTRSAELDRRPWKYPKWAEESMRRSFHLRSELFPYIYSSARQCSKDMLPLNRAMYHKYPNKEQAYRNPQQYFYGDALLASPIVTPGTVPGKVGSQIVWFPEGTWYDWFSGERHTGDSEIIAVADINEFPLYAKAGTPIPMQNYTPRMATDPVKELVVRAWPGDNGVRGEYSLYEDDGISMDYTAGKSATTKLSYLRKGKTVAVTIGAAKGSYKGQPSERSYILQLPATKKASSVTVDGKPAKAQFDAASKTNIIKIPKRSIRKAVKTLITVEPADQAAIISAAASRRLGAVDKTAANESLRDAIVRIAKTDDDESNPEIKTLLSIGGVSLVKKNEALYLYKGPSNVYFYARPGIMDGDTVNYSVFEITGGVMKTIYSKNIKVTRPVKIAVPKLPEMKAPDQFGVQASRFAAVEFKLKGQTFSTSEEIETRPSYLTKWNVAGVFDYKRGAPLDEQKFGPEEGEVSLSGVYKAVGGSKTKWRKAKPDADNAIDLNTFFHFEQYDKLAYGVTYIDSKSAQPALLKVASDDGIQVWLNGEALFTKDTSHGSSWMDSATVKTALKAGRNTLLVKVTQYYGDWKFRISIDTQEQVTETFGGK